ncbi:hypothetical protein BA177_08445 [Woeseia oceani]|uniref:Uncharacterized protein n=1 Tax=Woeseia oceani TaxID=1548547 RepID=A0A193LFJ3_9GAMM|nr:hypothetical protein BA177_08445 [Woeseia oceani]
MTLLFYKSANNFTVTGVSFRRLRIASAPRFGVRYLHGSCHVRPLRRPAGQAGRSIRVPH